MALALPLMATAAHAQTGAATGALAQRIGHFDRTKTHNTLGPHGGTGSMEFMRVLGPDSLSTVVQFLDMGFVNPHSSLGQHFHHNSEEMFISLDGPDAQFTINGRTSALKTPAGAPSRLGSSHAFYNPTDQPVLWLNFGVGNWSKTHDSFNLGDDRVGAPLDKIPQFVNFHMDPKLLKPVANMNGGTGTVMYRRLLGPTVFSTPWSYLDEISVPAGASVGVVTDPDMSEVYFVISGAGTVTVKGETASIKQGDAIPVDLGQPHSFTQAGSEPLHLLASGVAKDMMSKAAYIAKPGVLGAGWPAQN
jgi:mannose-6-phosphate isomerase-like protein (cupin superfamily)